MIVLAFIAAAAAVWIAAVEFEFRAWEARHAKTTGPHTGANRQAGGSDPSRMERSREDAANGSVRQAAAGCTVHTNRYARIGGKRG